MTALPQTSCLLTAHAKASNVILLADRRAGLGVVPSLAFENCSAPARENADMPDTPTIAEPGKPCRRWLQFRLRTLLVGVVLIGSAFGYVAREAAIVKEQSTFRERIERMGAKFTLAAGPGHVPAKLAGGHAGGRY